MLSEKKQKEFKKFINQWEINKLEKLPLNEFQIKNVRKILTSSKYFSHKDYYNHELYTRQLNLQELNKFLTATMGWIHCNPSKEKTIKLSKEAFIFPFNEGDELNILNTKKGMKNFFNDLVKNGKEGDVLVIKGKKGEGKTYTQNYFLNTHTKLLFEKGKTWFRIDLTKVLKYQKRYGKRLLLKDYLYAQIVYVYFRYAFKNEDIVSKDELLSKIDFLKLQEEAKKHYINTYKLDDFDEVLMKIQKKSLKQYNGHDGLNKPFKEKATHSLAITIINFLKENGHSFLLFIDGLDNVDYIYDRNINSWINEIYNGDISINLKPSRLILTCRPETLVYIEQTLRTRPYGEWESASHKEFILESVSHKEVLKNILSPLLNKELESKYPALMEELVSSGLDKGLIENIDVHILKDFYDFGLEFDKYVAMVISQRHEKFKVKSKDVLTMVYNSSLRDMIYDIKHAYMYIYYFLYQKAKRERTKRQSVISYIKEKEKSRSYLVLSSLSRHGCIYYNDTNIFTPPYMLLHSLNLFSIIDLRSHDETNFKDMFLSVIILNYLKNSTKLLSEIIEYCESLGFESKSVITKVEKKLLEHGLVELDIFGAEKRNYEVLPRKITERGKYSLTVMEDMDILHSFSYEMYFPQPFISFGIAKAHNNDLTDYASAQISNVLSILKLFQLCQEKNSFFRFDIFNENIKKQLINFSKSMSDNDIDNIINKFEEFLAEYSENNISCDMNKDELYKALISGKISQEEFERKLLKCFK